MKFLIILAMLVSALVTAAPVTLTWDANLEPDICGYELTWGDQSGVRPNKLTTLSETVAEIHTLEPGKTYHFAVRAQNKAGLYSPFSAEISFKMPSPNSKGWAVKFVDSEDMDGYAAELAIDGDANTFWHTIWRDGQPKTPHPHELQVDMGGTKTLSGFTHLPRQDNFPDGDTREFEFYLSTDGIAWGTPVATGEFFAGKQLSTVSFPAQAARYFRFVAKSEGRASAVTAVAELSVIEAPVVPAPIPPSAPTNLRRVVEIQTSSNLTDWTTIALVPQDPSTAPAEFVRARLASIAQP